MILHTNGSRIDLEIITYASHNSHYINSSCKHFRNDFEMHGTFGECPLNSHEFCAYCLLDSANLGDCEIPGLEAPGIHQLPTSTPFPNPPIPPPKLVPADLSTVRTPTYIVLHTYSRARGEGPQRAWARGWGAGGRPRFPVSKPKVSQSPRIFS